MSNKLQIVGRKTELERLHEIATITGTRSILFLTGPSGIGKTTLAQALDRYDDVNLVYIPFFDAPRNLRDAVEIIKKSLEKSRYSALRGLAKTLGEALAKAYIEKTTGLKVDLSLAGTDARKEVYEILNEIASHAEKIGGVVTVIVLDEAQNLLRGLKETGERWGNVIWGFIKGISTIQEKGEHIRFIIVTSDYFFHEDVFMNAPSLDYIDTFYLGELVKNDAMELYYKLRGSNTTLDFLDLLGGKPAQVREVARHPRPRERLCSIVRRFYNAIVQRLASLSGEINGYMDYSGPRGSIGLLLRDIASGPKPIARYYELRNELEREALSILEWLVDNDILQFSCKPYVGVYQWNKTCTGSHDEDCGGGGLCGGLDSIAASSRPALAAIVASLISLGGRLNVPKWVSRLVQECIGIEVK